MKKINESRKSMIWYKFLVYFAFWISAIVIASTGYMYTNLNPHEKLALLAHTEINPDLYIYQGMYLKKLDVTYGIILILSAILLIALIVSALKFKKETLTLLNTFYAIQCIAPVVYIATIAICAKNPMPVSSMPFGTIITNLFWWWINNKYFTKRKDLFVS